MAKRIIAIVISFILLFFSVMYLVTERHIQRDQLFCDHYYWCRDATFGSYNGRLVKLKLVRAMNGVLVFEKSDGDKIILPLRQVLDSCQNGE